MADTATVTFLHHSGLVVTVGKTMLVFDYWRGENEALSPDMQLKNADFSGYSQILVFVSHDHEDHFDEAIYEWDHEHLPITYVVSDDMPRGKRGKRMKPGDTLTIGSTEIRAFDSTDKGVSYYVTVEGLHIFHAGDLNLWHWREESSIREITQAENAFYAAINPLLRLPIDIAMFPVDPRMGGLFDAGANHFIMSVKPRLFIPIHWQGRPEVATNYARQGHTKYTEVLALTKPRERAVLTFKENELRIHMVSMKTPAQMPEEHDVSLDAFAADDPFSDTDLPVKI